VFKLQKMEFRLQYIEFRLQCIESTAVFEIYIYIARTIEL